MRDTKKKALFAAATLLVVGMLGATYSLSHPVHPEEQGRNASLRREMARLDHELRRAILETRYGRVNNYDAVVSLVHQIQHTHVLWAGELRRLGLEEEPQVKAAFEGLSGSVRGTERDIEVYKSHNSVLMNSMRYLGPAHERLLGHTTDLGLITASLQLLKSTYNRALFQDAGATAEIERLTRSLGEREGALQGDARESLHAFLFHAHRCFQESVVVDGKVRELSELGLEPRGDAVAALVSHHLSDLEAQGARYQTLSYVLAVLLLLGVIALVNALYKFYETLESRVLERTEQLREQRERAVRLHAQNQLILSHVDQGLALIDLEGQVQPGCSRAFEVWFEPGPDARLQELFAKIDEDPAEWLDIALDDLRDGLMPTSLLLDQMPDTLEGEEISYHCGYIPIEDAEERLESLLVVVTNTTSLRERERLEQEQREFVAIFTRLQEDRVGVLEFFSEVNSIMESLCQEGGAMELPEVKRSVHTIKGNAGLFGLHSLAHSCHELETQMEEFGELPSEQVLQDLSERWVELRTRLDMFLGESGARFEIDDEEYHALLTEVFQGVPHERLADRIRAWKLEPAEKRLERLASQAQALARRLGKGDVEVEIHASHARMEPEMWKSFWSSFVHVLRNAIDHGLETREERVLQGKSEQGHLKLSAYHTERSFCLSIADDGRGIDWEVLARRAEAQGVEVDKPQDALFVDGLSSRDAVTKVSGRGVGMSAVLRECEALGGCIEVRSKRGLGTEFVFEFPSGSATGRAAT